MAIRTPAHPDGFGAPPTSPLIIPGRDADGGTIRVWVPYDNTTKVLLDEITSHRDEACLYTKLLIGGTTVVPVPVGDGTLALADLGVTTFDEINEAGFTFEP